MLKVDPPSLRSETTASSRAQRGICCAGANRDPSSLRSSDDRWFPSPVGLRSRSYQCVTSRLDHTHRGRDETAMSATFDGMINVLLVRASKPNALM